MVPDPEKHQTSAVGGAERDFHGNDAVDATRVVGANTGNEAVGLADTIRFSVRGWGDSERSHFTIGRAPDNDIVIPHKNVSGHHALLHVRGSQLSIEDRNSANGTFVRGQRMEPGGMRAISDNEKIFVGPVPLIVTLADPNAPEKLPDSVDREVQSGKEANPDVFISYAREDEERAEQLANLLTLRGFSVWWDRRLRAGATFEQVIEDALAKARCVVVLWSRASVKSNWVRNEATEGLEREVLVPVLLEHVEQPLRFRHLHTISVANGLSERAKQSLIDAISHLTDMSTPSIRGPREAVLPTPAPASELPQVLRAEFAGPSATFTLLDGQTLCLGRDPAQCAVVLSDLRVSAWHATLKLEGQELLIRDEASNNGVCVNNTRLVPGVWSPAPSGSAVRFGPCSFEVQILTERADG